MQLISILAAGVNGAESGQATISVRGTSQPATTYASFEGAGPSTTGTVVLDANGGIEVYVNQYVDVVVVDSQGNTVREFTQGDATSAQEYIGQSFKGAGYDESAPLTVGQGVTTQAVLNRWLDSAGAPDWEALIGGAALPLTTILGALTDAVYNVKSAVYGAVGDGAADDTVAIQAAMTAASNAGGGLVVIPQGTYKITAALIPTATVSVIGAGSGATTLALAHATNDLLTPAGTVNIACSISGLTLVATQSSSGALFKPSGIWSGVLSRCSLGDTNSTAAVLDMTGVSPANAVIDNCDFKPAGNLATFIDTSGSTGRTTVQNCRFTSPGACNSTNGLIYGVAISLANCRFIISTSASGTYSVFKTSSTTVDAQMIGCQFTDSGGATVTGMEIGSYTSTSKFVENDNVVPLDDANGFTLYSYNANAANAHDAHVVLGTRETRLQFFGSSTTTPVNIDLQQYGLVTIERTGTASFTVDTTVTEEPLPGAGFTLQVLGAGTGTATYSVFRLIAPAAHVITAGKWDVIVGKGSVITGGHVWLGATSLDI